jgi:hypothetical protein
VLHLPYGLHCLLVLSLSEFHFFSSGVQLVGKCSSKGYLLLELEVYLISCGFHMDMGRSACALTEMSILYSIQELTMRERVTM